MTSTPSSGFSLGQWWKKHRKEILPPIYGIGGFLLFWQLSSSLGLTKLTGSFKLTGPIKQSSADLQINIHQTIFYSGCGLVWKY